MKERNSIREAAVLLFAALMILPTGAVLANTNTHEAVTPAPQTASRGMVWDNVLGVHGALGGIIVATARSDGCAFPADDFQFTKATTVDSIVWQGGYFQTQLAQGDIDYNWNWRVIFWTDNGDGTHPGQIIYNMTMPESTITRSLWYIYIRPDTGNHYWVANYSAPLPQSMSFDANTKYWMTLEGIGDYPPQACWVRHNDSVGGILLHQAVFEGVLWGYTDWVDLQTMAPDGLPHDLNFQLWGPGGDTTPPTTTCALDGTMSGGVYITPVGVTLSATDAESGVNYTMYKLDSGNWTKYIVGFTVLDEGSHTIAYYSVDKAGNSETPKSTPFTIDLPIEITVKGLFGVTATLKNAGTMNLTNVTWSIDVAGSLVLAGSHKGNTIAALAVGAETKVKDLPIGFGPITITVHGGDTVKVVTAKLLLIFVVGITG